MGAVLDEWLAIKPEATPPQQGSNFTPPAHVPDYLSGVNPEEMQPPQQQQPGPTQVPPRVVDVAPGVAESTKKTVDTNQELYDKLAKQADTNGIVEVNLRNLSDIYSKLQTGIGIPYESAAGKLLIQFGLNPTKFGLQHPGYVEEAKKAATAALYATMQQAPNLVADIEERQNLKPNVTLEPDAAWALINNGLLNVAMSDARFNHMNKYMDENNNSLMGYRIHTFRPDAAAIQERIYGTLPAPKGGGQIQPPSGRPVEGTEPIIQPTNPLPRSVPQQPITQSPQQFNAVLPQPGEVRKGWKFKGGNPADKTNWEKVQ